MMKKIVPKKRKSDDDGEIISGSNVRMIFSAHRERRKGNGGEACHDHADEVQLQDEQTGGVRSQRRDHREH